MRGRGPLSIAFVVLDALLVLGETAGQGCLEEMVCVCAAKCFLIAFVTISCCICAGTLINRVLNDVERCLCGFFLRVCASKADRSVCGTRRILSMRFLERRSPDVGGRTS